MRNERVERGRRDKPKGRFEFPGTLPPRYTGTPKRKIRKYEQLFVHVSLFNEVLFYFTNVVKHLPSSPSLTYTYTHTPLSSSFSTFGTIPIPPTPPLFSFIYIFISNDNHMFSPPPLSMYHRI